MYPDVPPEWQEVTFAADSAGLTLDVTSENDLIAVYVSRPQTADSWSLTRTKVAMGRSSLVVASSALAAIRKIAPQIAKKVEASPVEEPDEPVTVRLHPDDIEAIAKRVHELVARDIELVTSAIE